jgi:hypothetical protein
MAALVFVVVGSGVSDLMIGAGRSVQTRNPMVL